MAKEAERKPAAERRKMQAAVWDFDRSKLLISTRKAGITGSRLSELLLERYHLQMEMSAPDYAVGIASVADTEEGFDRLGRALHELDQELSQELEHRESCKGQQADGQEQQGRAVSVIPERLSLLPALPVLPARLTAGAAVEAEKELCALPACTGRTAADYVYLYPPGIPLIVPGEEVTAEAAGRIELWLSAGFTVHGLAEGQKLFVVRE